ncbi:MAG TPA: aldose 1-epimerase [Reyranella sp.]|nr:aldose 1-epimerase [Reyranella sp.]
MSLLSLKTGRLAVDLAPQSGGSIARFARDAVDLLRPGLGTQGAAYPLVPFSNRIANGELLFEGGMIRLERNWPNVRHPMHGDGWDRAWQVDKSDEHSADISFLHEPLSGRLRWPFRYRARQSYWLEPDRLVVRMALDNLEDRPVPGGIGLHPYFVRTPDAELACRTGAMWTSDAEVLPIERVAVPATADFSTSRNVDGTHLDNCFDDWDGRARVTWPSRKLSLSLEATEPFRHLVIYTPPDRAFFCAEPVSHANGRVGLSPLGPGATLSGEIVFRVQEKQ